MGNECCGPDSVVRDEKGNGDVVVDDYAKRELNKEQLTAAAEKVEEVKHITKEVFERGVRRILTLAIEGYPRALRSTLGRRNEILRQFGGNQDAAVDDVKDQAANLKEEATSFLMGVVPYVGLPASVLFPMWKATRRVCLFAAIYGFDMQSEVTRAKVVHTLAGMRAAAAGEYALEQAVQMVWSAVAGPVASMMPIGALASKAANIEGEVMKIMGNDTFKDGRRIVPSEEYVLELDPEPTRDDYLSLAKEGSAHVLMQARMRALAVLEGAKDQSTRRAVAGQVLEAGKGAVVTTAGTAVILGKGAVAAATDDQVHAAVKQKAGEVAADVGALLKAGKEKAMVKLLGEGEGADRKEKELGPPTDTR